MSSELTKLQEIVTAKATEIATLNIDILIQDGAMVVTGVLSIIAALNFIGKVIDKSLSPIDFCLPIIFGLLAATSVFMGGLCRRVPRSKKWSLINSSPRSPKLAKPYSRLSRAALCSGTTLTR